MGNETVSKNQQTNTQDSAKTAAPQTNQTHSSFAQYPTADTAIYPLPAQEQPSINELIQRARMAPHTLSRKHLVQLHRRFGNRGVMQLMQPTRQNASTISGQRNQRAADQAADAPGTNLSSGSKPIQRTEVPEEEPLQGKFAEPVRRESISNDKTSVQNKWHRATWNGNLQKTPLRAGRDLPDRNTGNIMNTYADKTQENKSQTVSSAISQNQSGTKPAFQFVDQRSEAVAQRKVQEEMKDRALRQHKMIQKKENKTGLPDHLKNGLENLSGMSMDHVKVHYNSAKPAQLNAHAYTQGSEIHVAPGQEKHLPHEGWHVVQQAQGRVRPTMQAKGVQINDDQSLEREADVMGGKTISVTQKKSNAEQSFGFVDNRSEAVAQRKSNKVTNKCLKAIPLVQLQKTLNINHGNVIQLRPLYSHEQEQLMIAKSHMREIMSDRAEILDTFAMLKEYDNNNEHLQDMESLKERMFTMDGFYSEIESTSKQAHTSDKSFDRFVRKINWYQHSGGKNLIKSMLKEIKRRDKKSISKKRDNLNEITGMDEKYFTQYLKKSKSAISVYRGDGRGVNANSLDNFNFSNIPPGGNPDISFYGVVQHTHSNTFKNGMVSTTSDFKGAHFWATESHNYGIVYEMQPTNYIDVTYLLNERNFKERYPGQHEILIPGAISADEVVSATLYQKDNIVKQVKNGK